MIEAERCNTWIMGSYFLASFTLEFVCWCRHDQLNIRFCYDFVAIDTLKFNRVMVVEARAKIFIVHGSEMEMADLAQGSEL